MAGLAYIQLKRKMVGFVVKRIYRFLGRRNALFTHLNTTISLLLGIELGWCTVNQQWVLFGVGIFIWLLWLATLLTSTHSYNHLIKTNDVCCDTENSKN